MQSKAPAATAAEKARFEKLFELVGCLPCRLEHGRYVAPEIHHLVEGGKRLGHSMTVPCCRWHHRSITQMRPSTAALEFGPPLGGSHAHIRYFVERYGTERELVALADRILAGEPLRSTLKDYIRGRT